MQFLSFNTKLALFLLILKVTKDKEKLKNSNENLLKNQADKIKEPSLDKLKKSERVDKTEKPQDQLKSEKSARSFSSNRQAEELAKNQGMLFFLN